MDRPVAIVGMACRFPGGISNPEKLWQTLAEGRNCWTNVPKDRFNEEAFFHPNPDFRGGHNHRGGHFLGQNVAAFDAQFFGLSATEVSSMDPQQRLLLELSYEAFESGGLPIESVRGSDTAVYVAAFTHDYDRNLSKDLDDIPKYHITGTGEAIMANRISYLFDLHGPSMTLDTGCSGSLVALHQGCQNLWTGESNMVLVAGVNLMLTPDHMIGMSNFK
jgi:acyl transferase domain-containing protein